MANTEHIAERKTVGAQGAQPDPPQQRGVQSVGQQVVPEQDDDTGETQRGGGPEAARRLLAKKEKAVDGVKQYRHRKDHRFQTGIDPGGGGIKTPEIKAEDAAALQQAAEMIFRAQRPQASCDEQNRQHRDAGYGETPENRYRRGHRSLL